MWKQLVRSQGLRLFSNCWLLPLTPSSMSSGVILLQMPYISFNSPLLLILRQEITASPCFYQVCMWISVKKQNYTLDINGCGCLKQGLKCCSGLDITWLYIHRASARLCCIKFVEEMTKISIWQLKHLLAPINMDKSYSWAFVCLGNYAWITSPYYPHINSFKSFQSKDWY